MMPLACDAPTGPVFDNPLDAEYIGPNGPVVASAWSTGVRLNWTQGTRPVDGYVVERTSSLREGDDWRFDPVSGVIRDPLSFDDSTLTDLHTRQYRIRGIGPEGPLHSSVLTVEFPRFTLPVKDTEYPVAVAFSADGRFVATSHANKAADPHHGSVVRVWDIAARQENHRFLSRNVGAEPEDLRHKMLPMAFSPDGRYLVLASYTVDIFDLIENRRTGEFFTDAYNLPNRIAFHPDGERFGLVLGEFGLTLDLRRLPDGTQEAFHLDPEAAFRGYVLDAAFTGDGNHFVVAYEETIRSWRMSDWTLESTIDLPAPMSAATIRDDGQQIATVRAPFLHVWERSGGRLESILPLDSGQIIRQVSMSDDLSLFATGSVRPDDWDRIHEVSIYRLSDGSHFRTLPPLDQLHAFASGPTHVFAFWGRESAVWNFNDTWRATAVARH